jgi:hypothetical protein
MFKEPPATSDNLKKLKALAAHWDKLKAAQARFGYDSAKRAFRAQVSDLAALAHDNPERLATAIPSTREKVQFMFAQKRQAVRQALARLSATIRAECAPVLENLACQSEQIANELEVEEKAIYDRFGAPHSASDLLKCLRDTPAYLRAENTSRVPAAPSAVLHRLVDL